MAYNVNPPKMQAAGSGEVVKLCGDKVGLRDDSHVLGGPNLGIITDGLLIFDYGDVTELVRELSAWLTEMDRRGGYEHRRGGERCDAVDRRRIKQ